MKAKTRFPYNRARLTLIVCLMAANCFYAIERVIDHQYPFGLPAILFLPPCLLRELDLKNGRALRRPGSFEWSCFIGGGLFFTVVPFFLSQQN
jgi:hypothetical protein